MRAEAERLTEQHAIALRDLVADVLGVDPSALNDDSGPGVEPAWDSLAHLSVMTAVEEEFGVRFSMEEIREISSFGALADAVARRLA